MFRIIMSPRARSVLVALVLLLPLQLPMLPAQSGVLFNDTLTIPLNRSVQVKIPANDLKDATYLRADFFAIPVRSRPHIVLYAATSRKFNPIVTTGNSKRFGYICNLSFPCFNNYTAVDNIGLLTRRVHLQTSIQLTPKNPSDVFLSVQNYFRNISTAGFFLSQDEFETEATGILLVRAITAETQNCPISLNGSICSNNGRCRKQRCECIDGFVGRACHHEAPTLSLNTTLQKFKRESHLPKTPLALSNFSQLTFQVDHTAPSSNKNTHLVLSISTNITTPRPCFLFSVTEAGNRNSFLYSNDSSLLPSLADALLTNPMRGTSYTITLQTLTGERDLKAYFSFLAPPIQSRLCVDRKI